MAGQQGRSRAFRAATNVDLTDNFAVFATRPPDVVTAAGFKLQVSAMGHWKPLRPLIRRTGFTEYVANLTGVGAGIITPAAFLKKLGDHVGNYRRLTTTLEAIGTRKGPPLYSAGALVAFSFDVMIRKATAGRRDIGTFFRNLWRYTHASDRKCAWGDIEAALRGAADLDWNGFYVEHIRGNAPLPLDAVFRGAGLVMSVAGDGSPVIARDPSANASQKALWKGIISRS